MLVPDRHPSTVADYDDTRQRTRLAETRFGNGWTTLRRTRLVLLRVELVPIVLLALFAQYWAGDIAPERARLARTEPVVLPIAAPADAQVRDTAVFDPFITELHDQELTAAHRSPSG